MELIASLPKPEGFFDPKTPAGAPIPPERVRQLADRRQRSRIRPTRTPRGRAGPASARCAASVDPVAANRPSLRQLGSRLQRRLVFVGNFHGFNIYDIERADKPRLLASVVCPGGQGDVSVHGHLLFMSVEQTRGRLDCGDAGRARLR